MFGIGDKVTYNNIDVTLLSVTENTGTDFFRPSDGNVFIICEFLIENKSSAEITVSSIISFDCYVDDYSTGLSITAMAASDLAQLDGTVASEKKITGMVGYEAPEDWSTIEK